MFIAFKATVPEVRDESCAATPQSRTVLLDNITRELLDNRSLKRYIDELSVTGWVSLQAD